MEELLKEILDSIKTRQKRRRVQTLRLAIRKRYYN